MCGRHCSSVVVCDQRGFAATPLESQEPSDSDILVSSSPARWLTPGERETATLTTGRVFSCRLAADLRENYV